MDTQINELLGKDKWNEILRMIENGDIKELDQEIVNGNSIYHFACIKGKIDFIKRLMELKNEGKINISFHLPNSNGLIGIELYYKYGGSDSYLLENQDICYVNNNGLHFGRYVVYDINLLEVLFKNMIKLGCLNNIDTISIDNILMMIMEQIIYYSDMNDPNNKNKDDDKKNRYVWIIKILCDIIDKFDIAYSAITTNCIDVIYLLMNNYNYDFSEISNIDKAISRKWSNMGRGVEVLIENGETFMNYIILANRAQIGMIILTYTYKVFGFNALIRLVTESGTDFSFRPIFLAINNNIPALNTIVETLQMCIDKDYMFTETDISRNTYLHYVFGMINKDDFKDLKPEIIEFFINHTDLDAENYAGVTPAHLLFSKGLWKHFKHVLKNRRIDLLKVDDVGKNCYSYVNDDDTAEFIELTKNIKVPIETVRTSKQKIKIKDMLTPEKKTTINTKNYGLFGGNGQHYMIYLWYLKNKFSSLYIPTQLYDKNIFDMEWFIFETCSKFVQSNTQNTLNKIIKYYFALCYSYLPHFIYWVNDDCYYVNKNLWRILEKHNQEVNVNNQRYVMIKITLGFAVDVTLHANVLLYDRLKKEAWRFEPYGTSKIMRNKALDNLLYDQLKIVYGDDVKYYNPDEYLEGINFQLVSEGMYSSQGGRNLGDPLGYCLAWSLWFVDVVLSHPDMHPKDIVHSLFTKKDINEILSEEEGEAIDSSNYYLDFIRRYAKKLDIEKNNILQSWGVKKYYMYNNVFNNDVTTIMKEKFTVT